MQNGNPQPNHDFGFIMEAGAKPKKFALHSPRSTRSRILIAVGALFALIIIGSLVSNLISSSSNKTLNDLKNLAMEQTEVMRIAEIGAEKSRDLTVSTLATTAAISLQSDQKQTVGYLKTAGQKMSTKELSAQKDSSTDAKLTQAAQNNTFDAVFKEVLNEKLLHYQKSVKTTYDSTTGKKTRTFLSDVYKNINLLVTQIKTS